MSVFARIQRQQLIREAEGYLDLLSVFDDESRLSLPVRSRLAQQCLMALDRISDGTGQNAMAQYLRGQAYRVMGRFSDAIPPFEAASVLEPQDITVWLALGWCYKRVGRLDSAIESLEAALAADPRLSIIHYNLACYWSLAGNPNRALEFLSQAVAMDNEYRLVADREADFDPIRNHPGFQALTTVIV